MEEKDNIFTYNVPWYFLLLIIYEYIFFIIVMLFYMIVFVAVLVDSFKYGSFYPDKGSIIVLILVAAGVLPLFCFDTLRRPYKIQIIENKFIIFLPFRVLTLDVSELISIDDGFNIFFNKYRFRIKVRFKRKIMWLYKNRRQFSEFLLRIESGNPNVKVKIDE